VKEPVISISLGNAGTFDYRPFGTNESEAKSVRMNSGDVIIFGGPARQLMHKVSNIFPNTAPKGLKMGKYSAGRFNFAFYDN